MSRKVFLLIEMFQKCLNLNRNISQDVMDVSMCVYFNVKLLAV